MSASFNKVIVVGNLTRDPELKYTPKGTAVTRIGLAVNRQWKSEAGEQKEEVTFIDIEVWGRSAENSAQYLKKGSSALIEGRLKLDTWEDKNTKQKMSKLKVVAEQVTFLSTPQGARSENPPAARPMSAAAPDPSEPDMPPSEPDDVPF